MALVSSGALHSCKDHLQNPHSVSAARLESLAFIQTQNGNASNCSVLPTATAFIFSLLSLSSESLTPQPQEGEVSLLGSSAHLAYFSASGLCRESALLSSTLLLYLCLAFTTAPFCCCLHLNPPHPFPTLLRRAKSLKGLFCS